MGDELKNSLKSRQVARIIDLLGEGRIKGPWNDRSSIYFDGVPVRTTSGQNNFEDYEIIGNAGFKDQKVLKGFAQQQAESVVGIKLTKGTPQTRRITDTNTDRARVTVSVPSLQKLAGKEGNIKGTIVTYDILMQNGNTPPYRRIKRDTIDGKTNTTYQRAHVFHLTGAPPWDIRLERITDDSEDTMLQNDLQWDSYTAITDRRVNFQHSAVIGYTIDADDFSSIPKRVVDCGGLYIKIPVNYDPVSRNYAGTWNGSFKEDWCNNPAWTFHDIIDNNRYGLGDFISLNEIDKYELYQIAKWCDEPVKDGKGGTEPRFVCNMVINNQFEAFDLINTMASIFRGSAFWAGGQVVPVADRPTGTSGLFTNANVIDGQFNYGGADMRAMHNQIQVPWNDPDNLGAPRIALVEDTASIARFGIQRTDVPAVGCTSESQALRVGKWALYTENYEAESVSFVIGLEGAWARPGMIIEISDANIAGTRRGGRLVDITTTKATLDAAVTLAAGLNYFLSCVRPDGTVQGVGVSAARGVPVTVLDLVGAFTTLPGKDSIWVLTSDDLVPTMWRVIKARQSEADRYEIEALAHNPGKWAYIEDNVKLSTPDISNIGGIEPISNLNAKDYLVALSATNLGVRMLVSWQCQAPIFEVAYRAQDGNWIRTRMSQAAFDVAVEEGDIYQIRVTPFNSLGNRGEYSEISYTVVGRTAPPADVVNFRVQNVNGVALFQWQPSDDLDVIIGGSFEIRYAPRLADVTWASSNTVIRSIPGTATTAELPYRPGTYSIKAKDIEGTFSVNAAAVIIAGDDQAHKLFVKINEHPTFTGVKENTTIQMPQEWLVLTAGQTEGKYTFANSINMGGVFNVRLTVDMLAFPFIPGTTFIDERPGMVDDWNNWDSVGDDGEGMVTILVRSTQTNPAGTPTWTSWAQFISGDYLGWGFQFQAWLAAPDGQNVGIEELSIVADVSNKLDSGSNVVWAPAPTKHHVTFTVVFFEVPSLSVAVQNLVTGDVIKISNKTKAGFDLEIFNSAGAMIAAGARTFDWIARGF